MLKHFTLSNGILAQLRVFFRYYLFISFSILNLIMYTKIILEVKLFEMRLSNQLRIISIWSKIKLWQVHEEAFLIMDLEFFFQVYVEAVNP